MEGADAAGEAENEACGDLLQLYVQIRDQRVMRATFKAFGCAAAVAAGSALTEMLCGRFVQELERIDREDLSQALGGLPPMKQHASVLAIDALRATLAAYRSGKES